MRLHRLELTAFGPFAGTETVDFDELCEAGLFLLTGPTGAGKTSILDAVCFALYGSVPGVRGVKALKSQHASDDTRPEVLLDFSVRERRFVVRRSPEWSRPKRRGTGSTTENARATLVETSTGEEHLLSSRAQEVGHLLGELIGMQATQFVQVAMLPQGDFQRFLRASSQERHDVLQHLFRTDRYARIEDWVQDHSRDLGARSAAERQGFLRVLDAVADRAGEPLPEDLSEDALHGPEAQERAQAWVAERVRAAEAAWSESRARHEAAEISLRFARDTLDEGLRLHAAHQRRTQALDALAEVEASSASARHQADRVDADDRAQRCLPLSVMLEDADGASRRARGCWDAVAEEILALGLVPGPVSTTEPELSELERRARTAAARLEALLPRERELAEQRDALDEARQRLTAAVHDQRAVADRTQDLPPRIAAARSDLARLATGAARLDALTLEVEQARHRLTASRQADECRTSLEGLREAGREARDRAADARERVLDLTERRLAGMAAELAIALADGDPCQVCGSTSHPMPAAPSGDPVDEHEQRTASAVADEAAAAYAAASSAVHRAEERLQGLQAAAGGCDVVAATEKVGDLEVDLQGARAAVEALGEAEALLALLLGEQETLAQDLRAHEVQVAELTHVLTAHETRIDDLERDLGLEVDLDVPLEQQLDDQRRAGTALEAATAALRDHVASSSRAAEVRVRADEAAREQGFEHLQAARTAALAPVERGRLTGLLEARARAEAQALATLEDPTVAALGDHPPPDMPTLEEEAARAIELAAAAARDWHHHEAHRDALQRQACRLEEAFAAWAPVRSQYLRAVSMANLVRGMGADNQLQMRLSAYVLATRLDQVVAAANERLGHMRDQRFLLQRTGRATRKGAQAGLGLEVVDQWTGDVREPTTLSGGETFVVSLSLALGLADVVTQEAGGTEIETLFVDEGFGTLDADTLDDVMDRLDDLRAGGRAVGVVSHVSELRNRIPTQLHVEKRRTGSTVVVRTAVG